MYRTYRNLYRIQPAITSIGQGPHRIRFPKGFQITLDMFILTIILMLPMMIVSAIFLKDIVPIPTPLLAIVIAGGISLKLSKIDPSGKSVVYFLGDILKYFLRKKTTDGFEEQSKLISYKVNQVIPVGLIEDWKAGSLPAVGYVKEFTLNGEYDVRLERDGMVTIGYQVRGGTKLPKGRYAIRNNQILRYKKER